jgi:cellobiose phosphorylase
LSGSASWAYYAATQHILGIQPDYWGLRIDPCVPSDWKEFKITRRFREKNFNITVKNESGVQKGVKRIVINGDEIQGNLISIEQMKNKNDVLVVMEG